MRKEDTQRVREVLDYGNPDFLDVYEFPAYDPDEPFGVEHEFDSPSHALEYALTQQAADMDRFVEQGGVQDEYAAYLKNRPVAS